MIKVETCNGCYAEMICDSISKDGKRIQTFNIKYGLIVHSEHLRHRLFSNSVKSNRAVNVKQIRKEVLEDPYIPVKFGQEQRGMVSSEEKDFKYAKVCRSLWKVGRYPAVAVHWVLTKLGLHKEVANRILNPWQWVRQTLTATEFDNFYNLRLHKDAQKDIEVIARAIKECSDKSIPMEIVVGEWHTPYVNRERTEDGVLRYYDNDGTELTTEEAIQASVARCARSSYDTHDGNKALYRKKEGKGRGDKELFEALLISEPVHGSPGESVATPMKKPTTPFTPSRWQDGVTHCDKEGGLWSGNLKGWIQFRQTLDNHTCWEYNSDK